MIFFQDKLESLPAKKVNQIRSTPTIGGVQVNVVSKMEMENTSINPMKSNMVINESLIKTGGLVTHKKENKQMLQKKKPLQLS